MICPILGCTSQKKTSAAKPLCAKHVKQLTDAERRGISTPDKASKTLRDVFLRLAIKDGFLAPDPLLKQVQITEAKMRPLV